MAALVLGLMVSSEKNTYHSVNEGLTQNAAGITNFDRTLAHYGPGTKVMRDQLRQGVIAKMERIWPKAKVGRSKVSEEAATNEFEVLAGMLRNLTPRDESQQILIARALQVFGELMQQRWSLIHQLQASIPAVFLVVLVFWFTVLFSVFALPSPGSLTVNVVMFVCALSVTGGIVLTLNMNRAFDGLVSVSRAPMEFFLRNLGR